MSDQPSTVLCVDDNADARDSLGVILGYAGYRVLEAATGAEALALAGRADLIVLDVRLPDVSGLEVARRVRADPATAAVPLVLLSGHYTGTDDRAEGLEGGGDVYLVKPVEPRELLGQVRALLRVRAAERRTADALRQAEAERRRLRTVTDHAPVLLAEVDPGMRFTFVNRAYAARFGLDPDAVIGRAVPDVLGEEAYRTIAPHLEAALAGRPGEFEKVVPYHGLGPRHMHAAYEPVFDAAGRVSGMVAALTDVTDRRQAERLEVVGQLAGGVAHDFNNLMTVVTGFAEVLLGGLPPDNPHRGVVEEIRRAGERAAALTQQLLAFSRRQIMQPRVIDLHALARGLEAELRAAAGSGVTVAVRMESRHGLVLADPGQVRRVVLHLAANAVEAMPRGGTLAVETRNADLDAAFAATRPGVLPGPYVVLEVSDTGAGLTAEAQARVFEPFFPTNPDGDGGRGLRMASVYGAVKQSGGHIEVESRPGAGTTFRVYLPRLPG